MQLLSGQVACAVCRTAQTSASRSILADSRGGLGRPRRAGGRQVSAPPVDMSALHVPAEWAACLDDCVHSDGAASVWMLTGPKNAGKSTLGRMVLNRAVDLCVP